MAKAKKKIPASRPPILKAALLVLACSVAGGALVYKYGSDIRGVTRRAREQISRSAAPAASRAAEAIKPALPTPAAPSPEPTAEAEPAVTNGKFAKMSRPQLEREVQRLREQLATRERENSEMQLELKLLREGSRTRR